MFTLSIESHFDAAHRLPDHPGKCKNLHGHRWRVVLRVTVEQASGKTGMVMDFGAAKALLETAMDKYDHKCLNDIPPFTTEAPTAERLAVELERQLAAGLAVFLCPEKPYWVRVEVHESPGAIISYEHGSYLATLDGKAIKNIPAWEQIRRAEPFTDPEGS